MKPDEVADSSAVPPSGVRCAEPGAAPRPPLRLVPQCREEDFEGFFRRNVSFVFRLLRNLGIPSRDIDDAVQEVMLVALRRIGSFVPGSEKSWLYAIAIRVASSHRRMLHRRREELGVFVETVVEEVSSSALDARRAGTRLLAAMESLPEPQRIAFVLHCIEDLPAKEIATLTAAPLQTVYTRLYAAKTHLTNVMQRFEMAVLEGGT